MGGGHMVGRVMGGWWGLVCVIMGGDGVVGVWWV